MIVPEARFKAGQPVTLSTTEESDPYITRFQYHGLIGEVVTDESRIADAMPRHGRAGDESGAWYTLQLRYTMPPDERFGPFPERRFIPDWRERNGGRPESRNRNSG